MKLMLKKWIDHEKKFMFSFSLNFGQKIIIKEYIYIYIYVKNIINIE